MGHLSALLTIGIWGTTFISTKILLADFQPVEILFFRFVMGLGASALCFVTWNFAVKVLGAVGTSLYMYMVPVITVVTSVIILHEKITPLAAAGTVLTLAGLFLSEGKLFLKKGETQHGPAG